MNDNLKMLLASINQRQSSRQMLQGVQVKKGTLCNRQGLIEGTPLNANGNRAYVKVADNRVVNAYIENAAITFQSGTGVSLRYDVEQKRFYITGQDAEAYIAAGATVQRDNPNSGDNLYRDSGFILDFLSQPVISSGTSTLIEIKPGKLPYNGNLVIYDGGQYDLSSYAASAGNHKILQTWFDPETIDIEFTTSTEQSEATAFDSTDWEEAFSGATDYWMPLQSWEMTDSSDTVITQANKLLDNRPIYLPPVSNVASIVNKIVVDANGAVVTDANGNVVVGA